MDTLEGVLEFATVLSSAGISVRVVNNKNGVDDSNWDHLTTIQDVMKKMKKVQYKRWTPLGTSLYHKILEPLIIKKAKSGTLKKPVIVITITDGKVCHIYLCLFKQVILTSSDVGQQRKGWIRTARKHSQMRKRVAQTWISTSVDGIPYFARR